MNSITKWSKRLVLAGLLLPGFFSADAQDKITIRGSNTIGEELAPRLIAEFKKTHPTVSFDLESKGTAYGIGALLGGYCDIAGASKAVSKEQEEVAQLRGVRFKEYILGTYTVAVLVNAANPLSNLTSNQVQLVFTGKVQNWKEIGGSDAPVHLVIRDPVSGTYIGFKEVAMAYQDYGKQVQLFTNDAAMAEAVAQDPNAIAYTGLDSLQHPGTKAVSIDGVMPGATTVNAHKYLYGRTLRFYTNANNESAITRDFINFVLSPGGQRIVAQMGDAPNP
ncbi:MAG TPA: phosphate ABC transporter substrate-binding protein [Candidatus Acidoferrales bacterium]|nr:phosphate ABC transporter substrate-binding protein [Candidatus Acidoferrales bacterium]